MKLIAAEILNVTYTDGGRVVSASGWETSVSNLTPTREMFLKIVIKIVLKNGSKNSCFLRREKKCDLAFWLPISSINLNNHIFYSYEKKMLAWSYD